MLPQGDPPFAAGKIDSMRSRQAYICVLVLIGWLLAGAEAGYSQFYFGKNKVQYTDFDWQVMSTEHFRIYFYKEESDIAATAAFLAEQAYDQLSVKFHHELRKPVPLIIYSSPSYFTQTNVIPGLLPESVAGFTEFLKGRVVLPFNGSYHDFEHVITHEMVHVFQIAKLEHVVSRQTTIRFEAPPLWFTEGLAEFWSKPWDTEADLVVKDMVLTNRLPSIEQLYVLSGTYYMYKLGESICTFIDSAYGSDKLILIYENWAKGKNFEEVIRVSLGEPLSDLSRKWQYALRKRYYPQLADRDLPQMEAEPITTDGFSVTGVPINLKHGDSTEPTLVYMANRLGYTGLYAKPLRKGGTIRTLVKGERSSTFESLHLLRSGIDAQNDGRVIFSSKSKERDVLNLFDIHERSILQRYEYDSIVSIRSPRFSPNGFQVVFTGYRSDGFADLYTVDLADGSLRQLTHSHTNEIDPAYALDGSSIVYASDAAAEGKEGATNLFQLDLRSGSVTQLTFGLFRDRSPEPSGRGIYFSSNRNGSFNLFLLDQTGVLTEQSTYVTGAFDPRVDPKGEALTFAGYQGMSYQLYHMPLQKETDTLPVDPIAFGIGWQAPRIDSSYTRASVKYDTDYSFDIAQSSIGYDPVYGSIGGLQAAMSDVLGNKSFYFLLTNSADSRDNFLSSFNVGVTYLNRQKRVNWGVGAFHLYDEYYNDIDQYYFERQAGVLGLLSYPLSKFSRFDLTGFGRYDFRDRRFGLADREAILYTQYVSWVYDNTLWDVSGPIEGRRYNLSLGATAALDETRMYNRLASADVRHYIRLGKYSAIANRLFAFTSNGLEPQRIYFGGSWSFRGYDRRAFYNRNVLFASNELRFPLIDDLFVKFPIGGLGFQAIRGALFADIGSAWDDEFDQFLGSFGAGVRVNLGYLVLLRFDFSRTTDFDTVSKTTDFDFFFGWNF